MNWLSHAICINFPNLHAVLSDQTLKVWSKTIPYSQINQITHFHFKKTQKKSRIIFFFHPHEDQPIFFWFPRFPAKMRLNMLQCHSECVHNNILVKWMSPNSYTLSEWRALYSWRGWQWHRGHWKVNQENWFSDN